MIALGSIPHQREFHALGCGCDVLVLKRGRVCTVNVVLVSSSAACPSPPVAVSPFILSPRLGVLSLFLRGRAFARYRHLPPLPVVFGICREILGLDFGTRQWSGRPGREAISVIRAAAVMEQASSPFLDDGFACLGFAWVCRRALLRTFRILEDLAIAFCSIVFGLGRSVLLVILSLALHMQFQFELHFLALGCGRSGDICLGAKDE